MQRNTVLVVEPDPAVRQVMRQALERLECTVVEAANGTRALSLAEARSPNLILLDLALPDGDALEFAQRLREGEKTGRVPIAVLAGEMVVGPRAARLAKLCAGTIPKPIVTARLDRDLRLLLSQVPRRRPRRFQRYPVRIPTLYRCKVRGAADETTFQPATVRTLSEGGLCLELPDALSSGSIVDLLLKTGELHIPISGKVIYAQFCRDARANNACYLHGVQLNSPSPEVLQHIQPLLKKHAVPAS
jgi:CheY-like chemotaxis protein